MRSKVERHGGSGNDNARAAILPRRLRAVAATLMRRRHRARVEDIAMPAEKTLGLSEQLARRPGKRCQGARLFRFRFAE
jgi:hypothetical protein